MHRVVEACLAEWKCFCTGWTFSVAAHLVINLGLIIGRLPGSILPAAKRQTWEVRLSKLVLALGDWLPSCLDSGELCTLILVIWLYKSTITKLLNPECVSKVRLLAGEKKIGSRTWTFLIQVGREVVSPWFNQAINGLARQKSSCAFCSGSWERQGYLGLLKQ